jgi:hypothetical protein
MNNQYLKKQESMKKKVGCVHTDCGKHFTFTIGEHVLALADDKKRIYTGKCSKCHKSIKLKDNATGVFTSVYGETNFEIMKSTFNEMFE